MQTVAQCHAIELEYTRPTMPGTTELCFAAINLPLPHFSRTFLKTSGLRSRGCSLKIGRAVTQNSLPVRYLAAMGDRGMAAGF
jgi:hypothetical protein